MNETLLQITNNFSFIFEGGSRGHFWVGWSKLAIEGGGWDLNVGIHLRTRSLAATVAIAPVTEANCDNDDD